MCGIVAAFNNNKQPVNEWVINQFEDQHSRGTQGFGMAFTDKKGQVTVRRATELVKAMFDLHGHPSSNVMFHHRLPTSTDNKMAQTHPMRISAGSLKYDYLVVHNGVIRNTQELKRRHEDELGFVYTTKYETGYSVTTEKFNDSECLAIEVARFIEEQSEEIGALGSCAFIAMQLDKSEKHPGKLVRVFFGRNTNPLHLSATRHKVRLSSEGEGENIKSDMLYSFKPGVQVKFDKRKMPFAKEAPAPSNLPTTQSSIGFDASRTTKQSDYSDYQWHDDGYPYSGGLGGYSSARRYKELSKDGGRDSNVTDEIYADEKLEELLEEANVDIQAEIDSLFEYMREGEMAVEFPVADTLNEISRLLKDLNGKVEKHYVETYVESQQLED